MTRVPSAQHPLIAREGSTAFCVTAIAGVALYLAFEQGAAIPAVVALGLLCIFFRDPHRDSPSLPLGVVAPADGHVLAVDQRWDPWLGRESLCVVSRMGLLNVHTLFSPLEGKIVEQWRTPAHATETCELRRGAVAYLIRTDEGDELVMEISRGHVNGPLHISRQPGERVGHGRRVGYATLGCTIALYLAERTRAEVDVAEKTTAASSVVATLMHDVPVSAISNQEV